MSDPTKGSPGSQSSADFAHPGLRIAAAVYALYFAVGHLQWWMNLLRVRAEFTDGNALIFPWLFLPFFASAGLAAGFAIWGTSRPDQIAVCGQAALVALGLYGICEIALDLAANRHGDYAVATKFLTISLLGLVVASAGRHASTSSTYPWSSMIRMVLSAIPSLLAVVVGNIAIEGWTNVWHNKLNGWAIFTTPLVATASVVGTAATIAFVLLAWRIQSRPLPQRATRIFPAHWNV